MTAERIYAVLLRFYPPAFRDEYGREMTQLFRDLYLVRGPVRLTFWTSVVLDVARSAPALRVEVWRARGRENTRTLGGIMKLFAMLTVLMGVFGALNALTEGMAGMRGTLDGTHQLAIVLGATAGALLLTAGIALFRRTPTGRRTATFAALGSLVIVVTARLAHPWMSIFSQLVGIGLPIALLAVLHLSRWRGSNRSAACALVCLLVPGLPIRASAQRQDRDTAAATAGPKDLPLTPAQRQRYIGTYATELPGGERVTLRILEENGSLKLWASAPDESRRLYYQGDDVFLMENSPGFVITFVLLHDVAMKFTVRKPEGELVAIRIK